MSATLQRKYAMTRIGPGSYLLPSNDGLTLLYIYSFEDGRSHGIDEPDRTWWACHRYVGSYEQAVDAVARDVDEYGYVRVHDDARWRQVDTYLPTRREAISRALAASGSPTGEKNT